MVSWNPARVYCTNCHFQTARRPGESSKDTIARWNTASRDGDGMYEIQIENAHRVHKFLSERNHVATKLIPGTSTTPITRELEETLPSLEPTPDELAEI